MLAFTYRILSRDKISQLSSDKIVPRLARFQSAQLALLSLDEYFRRMSEANEQYSDRGRLKRYHPEDSCESYRRLTLFRTSLREIKGKSLQVQMRTMRKNGCKSQQRIDKIDYLVGFTAEDPTYVDRNVLQAANHGIWYSSRCRYLVIVRSVAAPLWYLPSPTILVALLAPQFLRRWLLTP